MERYLITRTRDEAYQFVNMTPLTVAAAVAEMNALDPTGGFIFEPANAVLTSEE